MSVYIPLAGIEADEIWEGVDFSTSNGGVTDAIG